MIRSLRNDAVKYSINLLQNTFVTIGLLEREIVIRIFIPWYFKRNLEVINATSFFEFNLNWNECVAYFIVIADLILRSVFTVCWKEVARREKFFSP